MGGGRFASDRDLRRRTGIPLPAAGAAGAGAGGAVRAGAAAGVLLRRCAAGLDGPFYVEVRDLVYLLLGERRCRAELRIRAAAACAVEYSAVCAAMADVLVVGHDVFLQYSK